MYDLQGCRACLNKDCKLEQINDTTSRIYCAVTGLDFTPGDCYPSYFCTECSTQIRKTLTFRRRCRRAYFVLKEIVAVRQKVTLADLSIINRKKTKLTSNIDYWNNNHTGFYSVSKETDTKLSYVGEFLKFTDRPSTREDTTKYRPEVIKNTYIVVDIKPDNFKDVYDEDNEDDKHPAEVGLDVDDDTGGNEAVDDSVADIDLEDVFKGLPEEKSDEDSDYGLSELPEPEDSLLDEELNDSKYPCGIHVRTALKLSRTLVDFTVQLLSFDEQVATFQARKETEPYRSAGFKCAMCLIVYPDMPELLKHVQLHSNKQKKLSQEQRRDFQCSICKDTFACRAKLTAHSACCHWYKYRCNKCHVDKYTLLDTLKCHYTPPPVSTQYTMEELFRMSEMCAQARLAPMASNCRFCGWWYSNKPALRVHEKSHTAPPTTAAATPAQSRIRYQCDMCGLWCRIKAHLEHHMQTHYKTFTCKRCKNVFEGWNAAYDHLKKHAMFVCSHCDKRFSSKRKRREHESEHSSEPKLDCHLCGLSTYSLRDMYYHQLTSHGYISLNSLESTKQTRSVNSLSVGEAKYRCGMCDAQFGDEAALRTHKLEQGHVGADQMGGKCQSCKKIFFTVGEFLAHRRGNTICKRFPVKCVYCNEVLKHFYMSRRHYEREHPHLPNEHNNSMIYTVCELCGKSIAPSNMRKHKLRHTRPPAERAVACKLCARKMYSSRAYVSHMLFNHTPKPYLCAQCPYRAQHRSECRDHILKVHAPELPYACARCARQFAHLDLLEKHSLRAHGARHGYVHRPLKDVMGKVSVFPHMKIDGSLIPPAVIEDAGLYLYDFLCKTHKPVDWRDYYVFDTGVKPVEADPNLHKKPPKKPLDYYVNRKRKRTLKKPINNSIIKAIENQNLKIEVNPEAKETRGTKRKSERIAGRGKVKRAKLGQTSSRYGNADVDNVGHEMIIEYDTPDMQADTNAQRKEPQKRGRGRPRKTVNKVIVKAIDREYVDSDDEKMSKLEETSDVEHEETEQEYVMPDLHVQERDMPDLQADMSGDRSEANEADVIIEEGINGDETVEVEGQELDMSQILSENYQIVEENGEQYVVVNGNLYKLQIAEH